MYEKHYLSISRKLLPLNTVQVEAFYAEGVLHVTCVMYRFKHIRPVNPVNS